jgi:hypothetical protein
LTGFPNEATAQKVYDNRDFHRRVQAYLDCIRVALLSGMRKSYADFGPFNTTALLFEKLMGSKALWLTPNTESVDMECWLELEDKSALTNWTTSSRWRPLSSGDGPKDSYHKMGVILMNDCCFSMNKLRSNLLAAAPAVSERFLQAAGLTKINGLPGLSIGDMRLNSIPRDRLSTSYVVRDGRRTDQRLVECPRECHLCWSGRWNGA